MAGRSFRSSKERLHGVLVQFLYMSDKLETTVRYDRLKLSFFVRVGLSKE